jgi:hypothetical protein
MKEKSIDKIFIFLFWLFITINYDSSIIFYILALFIYYINENQLKKYKNKNSCLFYEAILPLGLKNA